MLNVGKLGVQVGRTLSQDGVEVRAHRMRGGNHCVVVWYPDAPARAVWGPSDVDERVALDATIPIARAAFSGHKYSQCTRLEA